MLHLGLGFSKLTLASRVAQAGASAAAFALKAGTPGALVLSHGAALRQSFHTAPRLDMRVSGKSGLRGCMLIILRKFIIFLVPICQFIFFLVPICQKYQLIDNINADFCYKSV